MTSTHNVYYHIDYTLNTDNHHIMDKCDYMVHVGVVNGVYI